MFDIENPLVCISDYLSFYSVKSPKHEAVICGGHRLNYRCLELKVRQCSKALLASGVKKGDCIAVIANPCVEYWVTFLAATKIGAIWMGINPKYRFQEVEYVVTDARPKIIFSMADSEQDTYIERIVGGCDGHKFIDTLVTTSNSCSSTISFDMFLSRSFEISDYQLKKSQKHVMANDPALLVYTSGSTGKPKGALLSHYGLCFGASVAAWHVDLDRPRTICNFPINHVACVADTCCVNLVAGGTIIFQNRFDPNLVLSAISEEHVTLLGGVPTMYLMLLDHPDFEKTNFSSVELIAWGGAAMPLDVVERLQTVSPRLMNVYGMTETAANTTYTSPDADLVELSETIGRPSPHTPCRILNDQGEECEVGEYGELQFKGEHLLLEYLNRPEATRDVYTKDGWLHTEDLGYWRENGTITLVGRLSDMFKSGGYNVYPREVEDILENFPAIEMAAVVAIPDPHYQEIGAAFIQVRDPSAFDIDALRAYCKTHLANYKIPKTFSMLKALPVLPIGKVDKVSLKQKAIAQQKETA